MPVLLHRWTSPPWLADEETYHQRTAREGRGYERPVAMVNTLVGSFPSVALHTVSFATANRVKIRP